MLHHDPLFSGQLQEATRPFLLGIDSDCACVMLHRRHIRVVRAHLTDADYSTSVSFASRGSAPCRADPHDSGSRTADNHAMGGSVLLVEDDNLVRAALAAGLAHHGFEVTAVGDARAAMASFAQSSPDVAVLDPHLGAGPTGIDLAAGMRQRQPSVGLVLLTWLRRRRVRPVPVVTIVLLGGVIGIVRSASMYAASVWLVLQEPDTALAWTRTPDAGGTTVTISIPI